MSGCGCHIPEQVIWRFSPPHSSRGSIPRSFNHAHACHARTSTPRLWPSARLWSLFSSVQPACPTCSANIVRDVRLVLVGEQGRPLTGVWRRSCSCPPQTTSRLLDIGRRPGLPRLRHDAHVLVPLTRFVARYDPVAREAGRDTELSLSGDERVGRTDWCPALQSAAGLANPRPQSVKSGGSQPSVSANPTPDDIPAYSARLHVVPVQCDRYLRLGFSLTCGPFASPPSPPLLSGLSICSVSSPAPGKTATRHGAGGKTTTKTLLATSDGCRRCCCCGGEGP